MRRTRIEIINDMLMAIIRLGGTIKPTHLMYKSNLSHALMKEYIKELTEKDLMKESTLKSRKVFEITEKGRDFTIQYRKMKEFQDAFGL